MWFSENISHLLHWFLKISSHPLPPQIWFTYFVRYVVSWASVHWSISSLVTFLFQELLLLLVSLIAKAPWRLAWAFDRELAKLTLHYLTGAINIKSKRHWYVAALHHMPILCLKQILLSKSGIFLMLCLWTGMAILWRHKCSLTSQWEWQLLE